MKFTLLVIDSPVKMPHILRTGTLEERVNVLRNIDNIEMSPEMSDRVVCRVGLALKASKKALLVKIENELSIAFPSFRRSDILDTMLFP